MKRKKYLYAEKSDRKRLVTFQKGVKKLEDYARNGNQWAVEEILIAVANFGFFVDLPHDRDIYGCSEERHVSRSNVSKKQKKTPWKMNNSIGLESKL